MITEAPEPEDAEAGYEASTSLFSYWELEDGPAKDEARRLVAMDLCRIDGGVVCKEWREWAPEIEAFLKNGTPLKVRAIGSLTSS